MRWDKNGIRNGMFVMGTQGERIGKVIRCDADTFVVEKGIFFPKDYELRYDHITDVAGGTVRYALSDFLRGRNIEETAVPSAAEPAEPATSARPAPQTRAAAGLAGDGAPARRGDRTEVREERSEAAREAREAAREARERSEQTERSERSEQTERSERSEREEIRIPLMREEIGIEKVARESGHVRIHKTVHSEERHFSVPVTREEIVIEHVAIEREDAPTVEHAFEEGTVDVPLYEEEVRVSKHPYLQEEVVVRTVARSIEQEGSAMLRHEEAEVEDTRRSAESSRSDEERYTAPDPRDTRR